MAIDNKNKGQDWSNQGLFYLKGNWDASDLPYPRGSVVVDDGWLGYAMNETNDRCAPQVSGDPFEFVPPTNWSSQQENTSALITGHRFNFNDYVTVSAVALYVPVPTTVQVYQQYFENPSEPTVSLSAPISLPMGRTDWPVGQRIVPPGIDWDVAIYQEASAGSTSFNALYVYKEDNGTPGSGEIFHQDNQREMRIHYTDKDDIDRETSLRALGIGDTIEGGGGSWEIVAVDQRSSHVRFDVLPESRLGSEPETTFTFTEKSTAALDYYVESGRWTSNQPSQATLQGIFQSADGARLASDDAYGVDLVMRTTEASSDWFLLAYTGT